MGWKDVVVFAIETEGAKSLYNSVQKGEIVPTEITSIAKSMGASRVSQVVSLPHTAGLAGLGQATRRQECARH